MDILNGNIRAINNRNRQFFFQFWQQQNEMPENLNKIKLRYQ